MDTAILSLDQIKGQEWLDEAARMYKRLGKYWAVDTYHFYDDGGNMPHLTLFDAEHCCRRAIAWMPTLQPPTRLTGVWRRLTFEEFCSVLHEIDTGQMPRGRVAPTVPPFQQSRPVQYFWPLVMAWTGLLLAALLIFLV